MSKQAVGNGIVRKDGRWVMLCGGREPVPIRLIDAQNREIEPNRTETKTAESHTSTVQETAE